MNLRQATEVAGALARREPATHVCRECDAPCHHVDGDGLCASCQPEACSCCGLIFAAEELSAGRGECKGCQRDRYDDEPEYEVEDDDE